MFKKLGMILSVMLIALTNFGFTSAFDNHITVQDGTLRKTIFALVSSAENSSLNYQKQYKYIEDIHDGRGYTAGIIGFTSKTGDLLDVVEKYQTLEPNNKLSKFISALKKVEGTSSHKGLGNKFVKTWKSSAKDKKFIQAQNEILDKMYMNPSIKLSQRDGLSSLGQYIYYDALVVHGPGNDKDSFGGIRNKTIKHVKTPAQGGSQKKYLLAFLKYRTRVMKKETAHQDLSRIKTQEKFIREKNYQLKLPLKWTMYGDKYYLTKEKLDKF
ncbi:chitosanase [Companilactobacillus hulinensis]|uniref:chitosanase n=1 Tax=Companilactobacillus hulinensis TaxID=2486007 RepID=UPI000F768EBA|nr:chitosanase [Companilactobacillus hulinensis]